MFIACLWSGYEKNDQKKKTHEADSHTNRQDFGLKNHIADCLLPIIEVIHSRRNHDNPCKVNTPDFAAVVFELLVWTLDRQRGEEISDELQAVSTRNDKIGVLHHWNQKDVTSVPFAHSVGHFLVWPQFCVGMHWRQHKDRHKVHKENNEDHAQSYARYRFLIRRVGWQVNRDKCRAEADSKEYVEGIQAVESGVVGFLLEVIEQVVAFSVVKFHFNNN